MGPYPNSCADKALIVAASLKAYGKYKRIKQIGKRYVEKSSAESKPKVLHNTEWFTAFYEKRYEDMQKMINIRGKEILESRQSDYFKKTVLLLSCELARYDAALMFLDWGANVHATDQEGKGKVI